MKIRFGLLFSLALYTSVAAAQSFTVDDVRLKGLERVEPGLVLRSLDIDSGQSVDQGDIAEATRRVFRTGYFDDIEIAREGDVLIVNVQERPAISLIRLEGNKVLEDEVLLDGLKQNGLREGDVFKRATLDKIRQDLLRLYAGQGRYGADIQVEIEPLTENRVALNIDIKEGKVATIQHINIVGNTVFTDEELKEDFSLKLPGFWDFFSDSDKYAREKLSGDLERLRSYYLDRGYINFTIDSSQVSLSPDKKHVFITVSVTEGEKFSVSGVSVAGDLVVDEQELMDAITVVEGATFSRREMTASQDALIRKLGDKGYLFANVSPVPQVQDDNTVNLQFFIAPGKLTYVRRVSVKGNTKTADKVARRSMTQVEGGLASSAAIERSKQKIDQTGYFREVNVETVPVPGTDDLVDLEYSVTEDNTGNFVASVGFSQTSGAIFNLSVEQENFLGSGNSVGFGITQSDTVTEYKFSYVEPYYTVDGVSRGYNIYSRETDYDEEDVSNYSTDTLGAGINFGYPMDDYQRLNFGLNYEGVKINTVDDTAPEVITFIENEGDQYNIFNVSLGWSDNHLNRKIFPTQGYSQSASIEIGIPGSDLSYHKEQYKGRIYFPLTEDGEGLVGSLRGRLAFAGKVADNEYPFFKNYYSGGLSSVRGYDSNSLGPRDSSDDEDPLGGNVAIDMSAELIFPVPFVKDSNSMRTLLFVDAGNVFQTDCLEGSTNCDSGIRLDDLRYSAGFGFSWLTPIGPISVALAKALNADDDDEERFFEFALGKTF
ncbi:outer membrane protein assembly factor BamA [Amphritea sp. 2_MG-2023]|uniref:outer membrane protein assembly factor BamA n=1 Tax=Amphritea TaxID=515417 RepID=UPI001C06EC52|nr:MULTISPECIES: outer membrane protein assembly factor BamA [Amphritea]MBU2964895.1 outer membrane protein assembly factor BamA [Amphritea atlantica]MDO6419942.1 outer membrane protein assembly factor BamA [Amphritea sp. 2_MG-2023]